MDNESTTNTLPPHKQLNGVWLTAVLILLLVLMIVASWSLKAGRNWIVVIVLMTAFVAIVGKCVTGRYAGILINERNLMSLSRLQMVIWTIIVISGYFVIGIMRVTHGGIASPLDIAIPPEVWALMGISAASLVGTPLIYASKMEKEPANAKAISEDLDKKYGFATNTTEKNKVGILYKNPSVNDAQLTDMFEGDELQDTNYVDVGKLQMFLFTILVASVYMVDLYHFIVSKGIFNDKLTFPLMSSGLLALMGVSNIGYLAHKGVSQTKTAQPNSPGKPAENAPAAKPDPNKAPT